MADKRANLIITLKDEVSSGLGKLSGALNTIKANFFAVTAAIGSMVAIGVDLVKSAVESEDSINKLNIALKNQGIFSKDLSKEMQEYATQLQKTTTFSDESILKTQAMLTTFGIAGKTMKDATQSTLDLASGLGVDLNTAAMLVGKAFAGETGTLSRYGIIIDENIPRSERFAMAIQQINQKFSGEAAAATQTFSGRVAVLGNQFDDIKEKIGGAIIPALELYVGHIKTIMDAMTEWGGIMNTLKITGLEFSKSIVEGILIGVNHLPILGSAWKLIGVDLDDINAKIDAQIAKIQQSTVVAQDESAKRLLDAKIKTAGQTDIEKRAQEERMKNEEKYRKENEKRVAGDIKVIQNRAKLEMDLDKQRAANFESTMNFISSLSQSKNKQLAAIGKAAAISQATMDTYAAANRALSSAPPPYNFILAALVTTAGLSNVARISGVQLGQGGMVLPRGGGVPATIAEAGHAEAVIPLDDERTRDKLQSSGFGGGLTVNIHAGVIIGGDDSMRALAVEIDKHLFELQRNKESVAFGGA
jgi:hypothetical protein